jgi:Tol biopolymer transport system component
MLAAALSTASGATRPDGRGRIVFQTQRYELAIVNPDGTGFRKLTRTLRQLGRPKWSPNGQWISFERLGRVWVISADGRRQRQVARGVWPAWAPDSRHLVFVDQAGSTDPAGEGVLRWGRITVLNLATGQRNVIGRGTMPEWSPDGKRVAFVRYSFTPVMRSHVANRSALFTVASDGSDSRMLFSGFETLVPGDWTVLYRPRWSPDSRTVAAYGEETNEGRNALVLLTDASGGAVRTLVPDVPASGSEVAWSPDGSKLAFTSDEWLARTFRWRESIETVDVVTGARKRVTRFGGRSFDWSPDGRQLVFARCAVGGLRCDLHTVAVADGRTRRIRAVEVTGWDSFDWE